MIAQVTKKMTAKATAIAVAKAKHVARIEHVLVGAVAVGLVTGIHLIEIVASVAIVAVEGTLLLASYGVEVVEA